MNKKYLAISFGILTSAIVLINAPSANASALSGSATLLIGPQTETCPYGAGTPPDCLIDALIPQSNYFAMDFAGDGFDEFDRIGIAAGIDGGLKLNIAQTGTTTNFNGGLGSIDATWSFLGSPGNHIHNSALAVTNGVGNTAAIDMTGFTLFWGDPGARVSIDVDTGASAIVTCGIDCSNGDTYTLDYDAFVSSDNFAGVHYALHLSGTVSSVPVPAAVWLFGSGLIGLIGMARREKA